MKTKLFTLLFSTLAIAISSQTDTWTKTDRTNLFEDCMSTITKYKNITGEQKESISLCYISEITKKYSKTEVDAMIDIEIKRTKEAMINQCSKNLGIELNSQIKGEEVVIEKKVEELKKNVNSRELLIGSWKSSDDGVISFKEDGTFLIKYNHYQTFNSTRTYYMVGNIYKGDWFLDENEIITLKCDWQEDIGRWKTDIQNYFGHKKFKISNISASYMKIVDENNAEGPIQCNKIKE
jgi:hypothetical protein